VAKSVAEQLIDQVFAALPVGTKTATGRVETAGHHEPPSVIAVPLGAPEIRQPDRPGDARYTDVGRQLWVRMFRIEWWCHNAPVEGSPGKFGEAEELYLDLLRAIRNVAHHSLEISDERCISQEEGGDGYENHGTTIVVTSTIGIAVYASRPAFVTLQATPKAVTTFTLNEEEITE
jgi:hypothetical protein